MNCIQTIVVSLILATILFTETHAAPEVLQSPPTVCNDHTPDNQYDGYCLLDTWIPGMITDETWHTQPPQNYTTRWLHQSQNVMEWTAKLKGYDGTEDYLALLSPSTAGQHAFLWIPELQEWHSKRVVDVAAKEHMWYHAIPLHSGGELSWADALRYGNDTWVNPNGMRYRWLTICITDHSPDLVCSTAPDLDHEDWFQSIASFEPR